MEQIEVVNGGAAGGGRSQAMQKAEQKVIVVGMEDSRRILTEIVAAAGAKTADCEECGRKFVLNEDETPYCTTCIAQAERELNEANARAHALSLYPKFEEWNGKRSGGLYVKDGELVMLDRRGREIHTICRSRKALAPVPTRNTSGEAARRLRQRERRAAKLANTI